MSQARQDLNDLYRECCVLSGGWQRQPSWKKAVSHGWALVPLLVYDLKNDEIKEACEGPNPWVAMSLLHAIVGDQRPKLKDPDHSGRYEHVRQMWLDWAAERGVQDGNQ